MLALHGKKNYMQLGTIFSAVCFTTLKINEVTLSATNYCKSKIAIVLTWFSKQVFAKFQVLLLISLKIEKCVSATSN